MVGVPGGGTRISRSEEETAALEWDNHCTNHTLLLIISLREE